MICDTTTLHLLCKLAQSIDEIFTDKRIFLLRPTQQLKKKRRNIYDMWHNAYLLCNVQHDRSMKFYEEGTPSREEFVGQKSWGETDPGKIQRGGGIERWRMEDSSRA